MTSSRCRLRPRPARQGPSSALLGARRGRHPDRTSWDSAASTRHGDGRAALIGSFALAVVLAGGGFVAFGACAPAAVAHRDRGSRRRPCSRRCLRPRPSLTSAARERGPRPASAGPAGGSAPVPRHPARAVAPRSPRARGMARARSRAAAPGDRPARAEDRPTCPGPWSARRHGHRDGRARATSSRASSHAGGAAGRARHARPRRAPSAAAGSRMTSRTLAEWRTVSATAALVGAARGGAAAPAARDTTPEDKSRRRSALRRGRALVSRATSPRRARSSPRASESIRASAPCCGSPTATRRAGRRRARGPRSWPRSRDGRDPARRP